MIEVDDSELQKLCAAVQNNLRKLPAQVARVGRETAKRLKREHPYRNRTGRTEANTGSSTMSTGDAIHMTVHVNVDHASILHRRKLLGAEGPIADAERELQELFEGVGDV